MAQVSKILGSNREKLGRRSPPETSVLGEDSTVHFCWSSTVSCFWWSSANVATVCVVVPRNQKHSTHALRNGENRVNQLSLCCLVRGKHLFGGSALGTNVKMPFSFQVMASIVWKSAGGTQFIFFFYLKRYLFIKPWSTQLRSRSILPSPCHLTDLWGIPAQMMSHLPGDTKELVWVHHPVSTQCTDCVQPWLNRRATTQCPELGIQQVADTLVGKLTYWAFGVVTHTHTHSHR